VIRRLGIAVVLACLALLTGGCFQGPQPNYVGGCSFPLNGRSHVTMYAYSTNDDATSNAAIVKIGELCKLVERATERP